ncbi:MAG: tetratricopeptide repeat protein [Polyangiaceae bacterium]
MSLTSSSTLRYLLARGALVALAALGIAGCGPATPLPATPEKQQAQRARVAKEEAPETLFERGRELARVGDNNRAEQYLSGAMDGGADPSKVLPLLLRVCIAERRYRVAIDYAEPYMRRRPDDYRLRFVIASLYHSIGEPQNARRELEQVVRSKPDHADAHFAMAVIYRDDDEDPVQADAHFREYLRIAPTGDHAPEARASLMRSTLEAPRIELKTVPPPAGEATPPTGVQLKEVPQPALAPAAPKPTLPPAKKPPAAAQPAPPASPR